MKNDLFFFYSSGASSQFVNLIKYTNTVVLISGMVREKGGKMTLFNIDLLCGKLKRSFFFYLNYYSILEVYIIFMHFIVHYMLVFVEK